MSVRETKQSHRTVSVISSSIWCSKGRKNRNVREIAQSLESLGGYLNAFTTKEQTCFYARVLDTNIGEAMDVLADLMLNATFESREMEKEKLVVIEELKNAEDDPEDIIHDYFEKYVVPAAHARESGDRHRSERPPVPPGRSEGPCACRTTARLNSSWRRQGTSIMNCWSALSTGTSAGFAAMMSRYPANRFPEQPARRK